MNKFIRIKSEDFIKKAELIFKNGWNVKDEPLFHRSQLLEKIDLRLIVNEDCVDSEMVSYLDKLYFSYKLILGLSLEARKNLYIYFNSNLVKNNLTVDLLLVRYNHILLVEYAGNHMCNNVYEDSNPSKMYYVLSSIEQQLKRHLPTDVILESELFKIGTASEIASSLSNTISKANELFKSSTIKELTKIIK